jgi:hypothetical protein
LIVAGAKRVVGTPPLPEKKNTHGLTTLRVPGTADVHADVKPIQLKTRVGRAAL